MPAKAIALGGAAPALADWIALSEGAEIRLAPGAVSAIRASRKVVEETLRSGATVYGLNTGFGKLSGVRVAPDDLETLQQNLVLSHATGVGEPLSPEVSRLAFALRVHSLGQGASGVRLELVQHMLRVAAAGLVPVIPSQGSVGASGDLAPLAHMALPLIGAGEVHCAGRVLPARKALARAGIEPIRLAAKEGLALINGTQIMTAIGLRSLHRALLISRSADIACATSIEALRGSAKPFRAAVQRLRPHRGQQRTAANLRRMLKGSRILPSHRNCDKVQDAYSLRCSPQVHGAVKDGLGFALGVLEVEAGSVTDNPLVFADGSVVSAGNFHGQPVSQALDYLKIAISTAANISERRTENLVNPDISGLPAFLADQPGLESGLMIPQVVAAALASENKVLAHPASVDTIPTSANREDHVSMGVTAARHAAQVVRNTAKVLAIELISACRGLDCGEPLAPGKGVGAAYRALRRVVPPLDGDRVLAPDLAAAETCILDGTLVAAVEAETGPLHSC